jgi:DNA-binding transcriptional MerR regulator
MSVASQNLWTIDELGAQVALALSVGYEGQSNGRVRDVPDQRTIRYYTTLGLIDRPAAMRGRTALYGRRHLLQLVAIKRLQVRGLTLAELQHRLVGLSNAALEELARLPPDVDAPADGSGTTATEPSARSADFWKAEPAAASPTADGSPESAESGAPPANAESPSGLIDLQGIRLDDGVTLLLSPARPVEPDDLEALHTVAAPLLKLLEKRRLLRPHQERRNA